MTSPNPGAKALLAALVVLLIAVPTLQMERSLAIECEPKCDDCHDSHDRVYYCYLDIIRFDVPSSLDGAERKQVEVQLRLYGNVGLGYTTVRRGWLELTSASGHVTVEQARQTFISYEPGYRSWFWNVSGRVEGTDYLHVEVYALGVHLNVEFFERADAGPVVVTNPVNAPPRVSFKQPDGYNDVASSSYNVELVIDDPNIDPMLGTFYYDDDRDRGNGTTLIARDVADPETFSWDTRSIPDGWYWLHVDVDDQRGGTDSATSRFPVIVSHTNRVPNVELVTPLPDGTVYDPRVTFIWRAEDLDGDDLTYEVWVGREVEHMEMVGTSDTTSFSFAPDDNSRLFWTVIPSDGKIRGWCRNGPWMFTTDIDYPVEVSLILPANGSVVTGPDVKVVWYGSDLDYEKVLYDVYLQRGGLPTKVAIGWDDPAGQFVVLHDLIPGAKYTWWVEGYNPYSPRGISQRWTFTLAGDGSPGAILHEELVGDDGIDVSWSPSPMGTPPAFYDVHMVGPDEGDVTVLAGTTSTTTTLRGLDEDATYHWYVIPFDDQGRQGASEPTFRTFTFDTNSPPSVTIARPWQEVAPGRRTLEWRADDPEGDAITFDVYLDPWNGTTLVAEGVEGSSLTVDLEPDLTYRWRVVPRDAQGHGEGATGVLVVGPAGTGVTVTGQLDHPMQDALVVGPLVNLTWYAQDPLGRLILYTLYVDLTGGAPLSTEPLVENGTLPWFVLEVPVGATVTWAVEARPLRGPTSLLGVSDFNVGEDAIEPPVARLKVGDAPRGAPVQATALEEVEMDATGSTSPGTSGLDYWFDFGDARSSGWQSSPKATHTYLKEGTYNATLKVRINGTDVESVLDWVIVEVSPGDLTSEEQVPAPGAASVALAIMGALGASALLRGRRRTCGGDRR